MEKEKTNTNSQFIYIGSLVEIAIFFSLLIDNQIVHPWLFKRFSFKPFWDQYNSIFPLSIKIYLYGIGISIFFFLLAFIIEHGVNASEIKERFKIREKIIWLLIALSTIGFLSHFYIDLIPEVDLMAIIVFIFCYSLFLWNISIVLTRK